MHTREKVRSFVEQQGYLQDALISHHLELDMLPCLCTQRDGCCVLSAQEPEERLQLLQSHLLYKSSLQFGGELHKLLYSEPSATRHWAPALGLMVQAHAALLFNSGTPVCIGYLS